jgi:tetratricopeptide (TPR) repeat protein
MRLSSLVLCAALVTPCALAAKPPEQRQRALEQYKAGQEALYSERFEEAVQHFRKAIALDPLLVMAHYGLGQAQMALKDYPAAVRAYLGCRTAFHDEQASRMLDSAEWERRLDAQVEAIDDRINALSGGHVQTGSFGGATTASTVQRLQEQRDTLRSQLQRSGSQAEPTPPWISLALGSAYFRNEAMADAEREFKAALEVDPKLGEAHNNLAVLYLIEKRPDEAMSEVEAAERSGFKVPEGLRRDIGRLKAAGKP